MVFMVFLSLFSWNDLHISYNIEYILFYLGSHACNSFYSVRGVLHYIYILIALLLCSLIVRNICESN